MLMINDNVDNRESSTEKKDTEAEVALCFSCVLCWTDSGVGTIYVSDDRGAVFSKSLERHLYTTTGSDTDFTVISSLRGVYMTSVLTEGGSTHTVQYVLTCLRGILWLASYCCMVTQIQGGSRCFSCMYNTVGKHQHPIMRTSVKFVFYCLPSMS